MTKSRFLPIALLSAGIAALLLAPAGAPPTEEGDADAAEPAHAPGTIAVDFTDDLDPDAARAIGDRAGVVLTLASEVSADEALYVGDVPDVAAALDALRGDPQVEAAEPLLEMSLLEPDIPELGESSTDAEPHDEATDLPDADPATSDVSAADAEPDVTLTATPVPPAARIFGYPDDPLYPKQWNFPMVDAGAGWRMGGGAGVIVAVIDTGVSPIPDLPADRILEGRSFVPGTKSARDDHGHGTHVASTIAEETNNGVGAAGIAPNAKILPLKVLGRSGAGTSAWIAAAIDEAVDQGAQVINMSLGGGHSAILVNAVEKARKAGVVVIAAAGNSGRQGLGSPADAPSAIAVSAVGPDDALAPYSSWGKGVEIAAPGGNKLVPGGGITQGTVGEGGKGSQFAEWQGTSMASPHVAGAAAVLFGAGAQSADEVERYLKGGAVTRDDSLKFGAGRLSVGAAVRKLVIAKQGLLFTVGALITLGLSMLGALPKRPRLASIVSGAVAAGGVFLLPLLPLPPSLWLRLLSKPFFAWPGPFWSGCPLWQSCIVPVGLAFLLGPSTYLGPLALGLCGGAGAYLLYGAATGGTDLWWMPIGLDRTWLTLNGSLCLLAGMAVAGMQKMRRSKGGVA